jgi:hypothetical protein
MKETTLMPARWPLAHSSPLDSRSTPSSHRSSPATATHRPPLERSLLANSPPDPLYVDAPRLWLTSSWPASPGLLVLIERQWLAAPRGVPPTCYSPHSSPSSTTPSSGNRRHRRPTSGNPHADAPLQQPLM